jgi:hypothetical protein
LRQAKHSAAAASFHLAPLPVRASLRIGRVASLGSVLVQDRPLAPVATIG